jgi:hypothetical protein
MPSEKALPEQEAMLLAYFLKAGNYQAEKVSVSLSEVIGYLKLDLDSLARVLHSLSIHGLIRLTSLPSNLGETFVNQVRNDIDILDLRYLERDIPELEYMSSRRTLSDEVKILSPQPEPLSPLEAAKLFRERDRKFEQMLQLTESSHLSELLNNELLSLGAKLRPFKNSVVSRINELRSSAEKRPDPLDEKRTRMLLLFSQVGLSRLATAEEVAPELLEELEVLRARNLVGEISESDLRASEEALWNEISKRMSPQLPDHEAFARWMRELNARLESVKSLRHKGILTEDVFQAVSEDLSEDIALLNSQISNTSS